MVSPHMKKVFANTCRLLHIPGDAKNKARYSQEEDSQQLAKHTCGRTGGDIVKVTIAGGYGRFNEAKYNKVPLIDSLIRDLLCLQPILLCPLCHDYNVIGYLWIVVKGERRVNSTTLPFQFNSSSSRAMNYEFGNQIFQLC